MPSPPHAPPRRHATPPPGRRPLGFQPGRPALGLAEGRLAFPGQRPPSRPRTAWPKAAEQQGTQAKPEAPKAAPSKGRATEPKNAAFSFSCKSEQKTRKNKERFFLKNRGHFFFSCCLKNARTERREKKLSWNIRALAGRASV